MDLISRQAAIDALQKEINKGIPPFNDVLGSIRAGVRLARNIIEDLPATQPCNLDEWCVDCKEYDHERHSCPRFNRVIRATMEEAKPKIGRWIRDECGELYCSECGRYTEDRHDMTSEFEGKKCIALVPPNYCGYCGAKMKEEADAT